MTYGVREELRSRRSQVRVLPGAPTSISSATYLLLQGTESVCLRAKTLPLRRSRSDARCPDARKVMRLRDRKAGSCKLLILRSNLILRTDRRHSDSGVSAAEHLIEGV